MVFHRLSTGCGKGVGKKPKKGKKVVETARKSRKGRRKRVEKRNSRGCGKLRGKRGKLFGGMPEIRFSTGSVGKVFRCGERLTGIRTKCDIPCRRSGDVGRNPTVFPVISVGFGSVFPFWRVRKGAEKPVLKGFLRNFAVFHNLNTPYYDYYDLNSSFFSSSFLSPRTENDRLQACMGGGFVLRIYLSSNAERPACRSAHSTTYLNSFYPVAERNGKPLSKSRWTGFGSEQPEFTERVRLQKNSTTKT